MTGNNQDRGVELGPLHLLVLAIWGSLMLGISSLSVGFFSSLGGLISSIFSLGTGLISSIFSLGFFILGGGIGGVVILGFLVCIFAKSWKLCMLRSTSCGQGGGSSE